MERFGFEIQQGEATLSTLRSVETRGPRAMWQRVAELAKSVGAPGCRIKVKDQSGQIVLLIGVSAVLRSLDKVFVA
jgi:hypothetical protein